jgi:dephospho-CoA kinase
MPLVALTGGIASGKSTIARRLAEHGAVVVDADQIVRDVQQPGSQVLRAIEAFAADPDAIVVYDVPLLAEARLADPWDVIAVAHAPADVRARRLVELRGLTPSEAAARISSQVSDEERLRLADAVIETGGALEETLRQTDDLWERLRG